VRAFVHAFVSLNSLAVQFVNRPYARDDCQKILTCHVVNIDIKLSVFFNISVSGMFSTAVSRCTLRINRFIVTGSALLLLLQHRSSAGRRRLRSQSSASSMNVVTCYNIAGWRS
jgi:hypothetical protein